MTATRKAFDKWCGREHYRKPKLDAFEAGWQAAIEHIKAQGAVAYSTKSKVGGVEGMLRADIADRSAKNLETHYFTPLYRIPEDV